MQFSKKAAKYDTASQSAPEIGTRWSPSARKGCAAKIAKIEIPSLLYLRIEINK